MRLPGLGEGVLETARGMEMGHVALGRSRRRPRPEGPRPAGKQVSVAMGSYGVGVGRAGPPWPRATRTRSAGLAARARPRRRTPRRHREGQNVFAAADEVTTELERRGVTVLYAAAARSPRREFQDAELLGVPTIVVMRRDLAEGTIEVRDRRSVAKRDVPVAEAVDAVVAEVRGGSAS